MVDERLMEVERWSGGGLQRLGATRRGDGGLVEARSMWETAGLGVKDGLLDASTRDGDGKMDLHEAGHEEKRRVCEGATGKRRVRRVYTHSPW